MAIPPNADDAGDLWQQLFKEAVTKVRAINGLTGRERVLLPCLLTLLRMAGELRDLTNGHYSITIGQYMDGEPIHMNLDEVWATMWHNVVDAVAATGLERLVREERVRAGMQEVDITGPEEADGETVQ